MNRAEKIGAWVLGGAIFAGLFYVIYTSFSPAYPVEEPLAGEPSDPGLDLEEETPVVSDAPPSR